MAVTSANHGIISLDEIAQETVILIGPLLDFYKNCARNFSNERMSIAPGQTLNVKFPGARTAQSRNITAAAYPAAVDGTSADRSIALTDEIFIDDNFTGLELQQSTLFDLRNLYLEQNAIAIAEGIIGHGMSTIRTTLPGGNSQVVALGSFGRHTLEAKRAAFDAAKIPARGRWAVISTDYASELADELVTLTNPGLAKESSDAYVQGALPPFIAGFRVYVTAAITGEAFFGNQNTLGVVAALPWVPANEMGHVQYMDVQDAVTGLPLQFRHRWATDPVEQYETKQRLYIGHKLFSSESTLRVATA